MNYDFTAIPDQQVPQAKDPLFQHVVITYASETNKTASMWRAIPDDMLDFKFVGSSQEGEPKGCASHDHQMSQPPKNTILLDLPAASLGLRRLPELMVQGIAGESTKRGVCRCA